MTAFRYSLPMLKKHNIHYVHYRFSVLAVNNSTQLILIKNPLAIKEKMGASRSGTSGARLSTLQLTTSHSQRLNSEKPLGTGCCERLWSIATWANETLSAETLTDRSVNSCISCGTT